MDNLETQPMDETQMSEAQTSFKDECVPCIVGEHNGPMTFDEEPLGESPLCSPCKDDQYMIKSDGLEEIPLSPEGDVRDASVASLSPPQEFEEVASLESPLSPSLEPEGDIMKGEEGPGLSNEGDLCPPHGDVKAVQHPPLDEVAQLYFFE